MDKKPNMRWRKVVARLFVRMVYEPGNKNRNLQFIHKNFINENQGIAYKTFLGYLDEEKDDLSDLTLPVHFVRSMWDCVNYRLAALDNRPVSLPSDLEKRFNLFEGYKKRMQEENESERAKIVGKRTGRKRGLRTSKRSGKAAATPAVKGGK